MRMILIAAVDRRWAIGRDGALLFRIPADMRRFQALTMGHTVVMGRKTLCSLPGGKPLRGRENIVMTRNPAFLKEGAKSCGSLQALGALLAGKPKGSEVFIIGGEEIYKLLLPYAEQALITHVCAARRADCFFPRISRLPGWEQRECSGPYEENGLRFYYANYFNLQAQALGITIP